MRIFILALLFTFGCTDAMFSKFSTIGSRAEVKCYSGSRLIFWGISTGKVSNEENSDGFFARWKVKEVAGQWDHVDVGQTLPASISGNCIIVYEE